MLHNNIQISFARIIKGKSVNGPPSTILMEQINLPNQLIRPKIQGCAKSNHTRKVKLHRAI